MVQSTQIWEVAIIRANPVATKKIEKQYGSRRSGTIYVVADDPGEVRAIINEIFTRNGYAIPEQISSSRTHLVHQALKMVY